MIISILQIQLQVKIYYAATQQAYPTCFIVGYVLLILPRLIFMHLIMHVIDKKCIKSSMKSLHNYFPSGPYGT